MATRLIGTDTADPRLPADVITATAGTTSNDLAIGTTLATANAYTDSEIAALPGGITTEDAVDAIAAALIEGAGIDIVYSDGANTITVTADKTEMSLNKTDVGLGNVDNTADTAKPISTATQTALDAKQPLDGDLTTIAALTATTDNIIQSSGSAWASRTPSQLKTTLALTKSDVGLSNVDNTADASKPVFTTSTAGIVPASGGGTTNYLRADGTFTAPPGGGGGITSEDAVDAVATALTEGTGIDIVYDDGLNTITVATTGMASSSDLSTHASDTTAIHGIADTSLLATTAALAAYQPIDTDLTTIAGLTATTDNVLQSVSSAWASRTPAQLKTTLALVKGDVGLGNVDNTSDANKPVSTATQTALDLKANIARTITTYSGTSLTGVLGDAGAYLRCTGTNPTYTVPLNASVAYPTGTQIDGVGTATAMTIAATGGVTINKARTLVTVGADSGWTLIKVGTDEWDCHGDFV